MKKDKHKTGDYMCVSCGGGFTREEISTWNDEDFCYGCFSRITIYRKVKLTGNIREVS